MSYWSRFAGEKEITKKILLRKFPRLTIGYSGAAPEDANNEINCPGGKACRLSDFARALALHVHVPYQANPHQTMLQNKRYCLHGATTQKGSEKLVPSAHPFTDCLVCRR